MSQLLELRERRHRLSVSHKPGSLPRSFEYSVQTLVVKMSPIYLAFFGLISLPKVFHFYETKVLSVDCVV